MPLQKLLRMFKVKYHNKKTGERKLKQNLRRLLAIQEKLREPIMIDNETTVKENSIFWFNKK